MNKGKAQMASQQHDDFVKEMFYDERRIFWNSNLVKYVLGEIERKNIYYGAKSNDEKFIKGAYDIIESIANCITNIRIAASYFKEPFPTHEYDLKGISFIEFAKYHYTHFLYNIGTLNDLLYKLILLSYNQQDYNNQKKHSWQYITKELKLNLNEEIVKLRENFFKNNKQFIKEERNKATHEGKVSIKDSSIEDIMDNLRIYLPKEHPFKKEYDVDIITASERIKISNRLYFFLIKKKNEMARTFNNLFVLLYDTFVMNYNKLIK